MVQTKSGEHVVKRVPPRAGWSTRPLGDSTSPRDRIIAAAIIFMRRNGVDRTSISGVATEAGVSRQTVYAHFRSRDELVDAAVRASSDSLATRIIESVLPQAESAADFVVEALIAARAEFRADRSLETLSIAPQLHWTARALSDEALAVAAEIFRPILELEPELADRFDELCETIIRWLLSLVMFDSERTSDDSALRTYLRATVAPAVEVLKSP